jgi:hypothetical protein
MKDLAGSPADVRALARFLLTGEGRGDTAWTDWELDFLESMASRFSEEPLSMRQREVLSELKSVAERITHIDGLNVRALIERCWMERADLADEEDEAFIEALKTSGQRSVTGRQRGRLLRCCRALQVIESHHGWAA